MHHAAAAWRPSSLPPSAASRTGRRAGLASERASERLLLLGPLSSRDGVVAARQRRSRRPECEGGEPAPPPRQLLSGLARRVFCWKEGGREQQAGSARQALAWNFAWLGKTGRLGSARLCCPPKARGPPAAATTTTGREPASQPCCQSFQTLSEREGRPELSHFSIGGRS